MILKSLGHPQALPLQIKPFGRCVNRPYALNPFGHGVPCPFDFKIFGKSEKFVGAQHAVPEELIKPVGAALADAHFGHGGAVPLQKNGQGQALPLQFNPLWAIRESPLRLFRAIRELPLKMPILYTIENAHPIFKKPCLFSEISL